MNGETWRATIGQSRRVQTIDIALVDEVNEFVKVGKFDQVSKFDQVGKFDQESKFD
jgi:hypothetical protein